MRKVLILTAAVLLALAAAQQTSKTSSTSQTTTNKGKPTSTKPQGSTGKTTTNKKGSTSKPSNSAKKANYVADSFKDWKKKNGKQYSSTGKKTESQAEKTFNANVEKIKKHNSNPKATYKQTTNRNADLTPQEIKKYRLGLKPTPKNFKFPGKASNKTSKSAKNKKFETIKSKDTKYKKGSPKFKTSLDAKVTKKFKANIPDTLDYSDYLGPARDQGNCGACWAFSMVTTMEYWSNKNGTPQIYSEQNLIDCVSVNEGCDGGSFVMGYVYVMTNGIADGTKYKFVEKNQKCQQNKYPAIYYLPNTCYIILESGDEEMLKMMVAKYGPVVVGINAADSGLEYYDSGVFETSSCSSDPDKGDHAVTVIGYGTDPDYGDYWLIRNSWGQYFGENGNFRLARNKGNMCGVANIVAAPCPL